MSDIDKIHQLRKLAQSSSIFRNAGKKLKVFNTIIELSNGFTKAFQTSCRRLSETYEISLGTINNSLREFENYGLIAIHTPDRNPHNQQLTTIVPCLDKALDKLHNTQIEESEISVRKSKIAGISAELIERLIVALNENTVSNNTLRETIESIRLMPITANTVNTVPMHPEYPDNQIDINTDEVSTASVQSDESEHNIDNSYNKPNNSISNYSDGEADRKKQSKQNWKAFNDLWTGLQPWLNAYRDNPDEANKGVVISQYEKISTLYSDGGCTDKQYEMVKRNVAPLLNDSNSIDGIFSVDENSHTAENDSAAIKKLHNERFGAYVNYLERCYKNTDVEYNLVKDAQAAMSYIDQMATDGLISEKQYAWAYTRLELTKAKLSDTIVKNNMDEVKQKAHDAFIDRCSNYPKSIHLDINPSSQDILESINNILREYQAIGIDQKYKADEVLRDFYAICNGEYRAPGFENQGWYMKQVLDRCVLIDDLYRAEYFKRYCQMVTKDSSMVVIAA